jgi:signal transduction histidine kinase
VLLLGLGASHLIGLAIYAGDRSLALTAQHVRDAAARIATAVRTFEAAEPDVRRALGRSMWAPGFGVRWTEESAITTEDRGWRARLVRGAIADALEGYETERIRIVRRGIAPGQPPPIGFALPPEPMHPGEMHLRRMRAMGMGMAPSMAGHMAQMAAAWQQGEILEASVRLDDGSWLNFAVLTPGTEPFWWSRFFLSIVVMTVTVILISVWALRRATRPLAVFAQAAARLGLDVGAPPVPETGPREVSQLARAFNDMQRRLAAFVQDRTQMLAAISHDLRTPITRLRLRADFIEDAEQQRKMLADLDEMEAMIAATLSFAREDVTRETPRAFDLAVLLRDLCEDAVEGGGRAAYRGPASCSYVGRPVALKRVFANLIGNAVKYGGSAEVSLAADGADVTVTVDDEGPGVPEDKLEAVFAPFYRLDASRSRDTGGVGLGLASARAVVHAHGGRVALANRAAGGLRATVTLPSA